MNSCCLLMKKWTDCVMVTLWTSTVVFVIEKVLNPWCLRMSGCLRAPCHLKCSLHKEELNHKHETHAFAFLVLLAIQIYWPWLHECLHHSAHSHTFWHSMVLMTTSTVDTSIDGITFALPIILDCRNVHDPSLHIAAAETSELS